MELLFKKLNTIKSVSPALQTYLEEHCSGFQFGLSEEVPYQLYSHEIIFFVTSGSLSGMIKPQNTVLPIVHYGPGDFIFPALTSLKDQFIDSLACHAPAKVLGLRLWDAKSALDIFPEAFDLFIGIIDEEMNKSHQRELFLRMKTEERYNFLFKNNRSLFMHYNSEQLAAYLNISKRQLMRLKNH